MLPVVMRVKMSSVELMAADALLPSRERTTNVRANCWVVFMFLSFYLLSGTLNNAPTVPKTAQSLSSLFLEPRSSGLGGMPEQQSIGKNPSPHVVGRREHSSSTSIPNRWRVNAALWSAVRAPFPHRIRRAWGRARYADSASAEAERYPGGNPNQIVPTPQGIAHSGKTRSAWLAH